METATYYIAFLTILIVPLAVVYWMLIHPFAATWRRIGAFRTYAIVLPILFACALLIWLVREPVLRIRFGFRWPLAALGVASYLGAVWLDRLCRRQLEFRAMIGLPEISGRDPGTLLTEGVYGRVRNPRYLVTGLVLVAFALVSNYLAVWLLVAASVPLAHLVVLFEERELRQRFGAEYEGYLRRVPRFLPRLRRAR